MSYVSREIQTRQCYFTFFYHFLLSLLLCPDIQTCRFRQLLKKFLFGQYELCLTELTRNTLTFLLASVLTYSYVSILQLLPANTRAIRVMPNTPSTVLCGASAFARGSTTRPEDAAPVLRLFSSVGFCIEVSEAELDAVTGLSGSGPAYVSIHLYTVSRVISSAY